MEEVEGKDKEEQLVVEREKRVKEGAPWMTMDECEKTPQLWESQFEKILLKHCWENIPNWECLFVHREKGLFLSVCG